MARTSPVGRRLVVQVTILFIRLTCRYIVAPREWGEPLMIGTPGRARTDTGALLGGSPLPLGYGGAKIVPHLAPFIQTFRGIGQVAIIDDQIDISHAHNCAVAHAICHCCRWGGGRSSVRGRRPTTLARCPGCALGLGLGPGGIRRFPRGWRLAGRWHRASGP